ncbi:MAG TPA: hypothetical protein VN622_05865 [Clostridia bacterium]|nr:hypothetical protein [Clostridia bacterium]
MNPAEYEFIIPESEEKATCATSPAESTPGSDPDEESLKARALFPWSEEERCVDKLAPLLYELCKKMNAQGKKGKGFRAWLIANEKKPTTAYRWIREYAEQNGLELPYAHTATKPTSSHVGQGSQAGADTAPAASGASSPIWQVCQMSEPEQIALLGGTFVGVLKSARELLEMPEKAFDPNTQDVAVFGSPEYHWTPQDNSAELAKAQAYLIALKTTLKALNRETKEVRSRVSAVSKHIEKLKDNQQPFFQVVPKAQATGEQPVQKKTA